MTTIPAKVKRISSFVTDPDPSSSLLGAPDAGWAIVTR